MFAFRARSRTDAASKEESVAGGLEVDVETEDKDEGASFELSSVASSLPRSRGFDALPDADELTALCFFCGHSRSSDESFFSSRWELIIKRSPGKAE